jgi:hypothetical protein
MPRIWSYLYTTQTNNGVAQSFINSGGDMANAISASNGNNSTDSTNNIEGVDSAGGHPTNAVGPMGDAGTPMSGFGYGLPISRLYMRFWGGDLDLVSVEGYGSDAYMTLPKNAEMNDSAS